MNGTNTAKPKRRLVRVTFKCTEDEKAAILAFAKNVRRSASNAVNAIVTNHLKVRPTSLKVVPFPPSLSLELWIWAATESQKKRPDEKIPLGHMSYN